MKRAAAIFAFLVISTGVAHADRRVALVLGTDAYKTIRPLDNAVNDAQAIEEALAALDFEVFLETNRDLHRMRRALEDFREDAAGADVALVFYAGHGVEIAGENRLLPTDADASSLDALKASTLPLNEVRDAIAEAGKVGLIVLDACRNDPFGAVAADGRGAAALKSEIVDQVKPGFGRIGRAENILFSFSAAPGATAADGDGENSPFTSALVKYLGTDGLEIRSVLTLVQQEVYDLSRGGQLPYVENGLPQLFFASSQESELPERERLLLAMADVTPDLRVEVERLAAENNMPLAPLYAAMISSDAQSLSQAERMTRLADAARAFVETQTQIRTLSSADPAVTKLREEAEAELALGAFDGARAKLAQAATIDSVSRDTLKANYVERTVSEAITHLISGGTSRADLNYELAIASFQHASTLFDEVNDAKLSDEQRLAQLDVYETLGDLYVTVGNLAEGSRAYERQLAVSGSLVDTDPNNLRWKERMAASALNLGRVLRGQGSSSNALAGAEVALEILQTVTAAEPANLTALGLLADAGLEVGSLHFLQGDGEEAIAAYQEARAVAERLTGLDSENAGWKATLSRSHRLIGKTLHHDNKLREAESSYQAALAIVSVLAGEKPDDAVRQADLADAYEDIGSIEYDLIDRSKYTETGSEPALTAYKQSISISRLQGERDPRNTAWKSRLAGTLEKLGQAIYFGDSMITKEHADASLAAFTESIDIREKLVASDPANKVWVGDLGKAYESLATWYEFIPDDVTAISYSKKAHEALLQLAALDENNVEWQRNATLYYAKIAGSYIQLKDFKNAIVNDEAGLARAVEIAELNSDKQVYQGDVIVFYTRLANDYFRQKNYEKFWEQNDLKLKAAQAFAKRFPDNPNTMRDLATACMDVASTYTANFPKDAVELFKEARKAAEHGAAIEPSDANLIFLAYDAQVKTGYVLEEQGDRAGALAAYEGALKTIEKAVSLEPSNVGYTASVDHVKARIEGVR